MMRLIPAILAAALILAPSVAPGQITDGSFEAASSGSPPGPAWSVSPGAVATIEGFALPIHDYAFMPSDGNRYLRLTPGTTVSTNPGHGLHSTPSVGKVWQTFTVPAHQHIALSVDWEFVQLEGTPDPTFNDFLSIDVIKLVTISGVGQVPFLLKNVVFVDTGTSTTSDAYTNVPGAGPGSNQISWVPNQTAFGSSGTHNPAPAGFKRAWVDLTGLSTVAAGATLRIDISVGNVGDAGFDSVALIDNVRLLVAQKNQIGGRLRVLSSAHTDGQATANDFGGDQLEAAPYAFRTMQGQRLAFRAASAWEDIPWALFYGDLLPTGQFHPGVGTVNLANAQTMIDGIAPGGGDDWLGTITFNYNYLDMQVGGNVSPGTTVAFQGLMLAPAASTPIVLTAATEVRVGGTSSGGPYSLFIPPQMPLGSAPVTPVNTGGQDYSGGATSDDGATSLNLASLGFAGGSWPFFSGVYSEIWVGSNGYLTFGGPDSSPIENEDQMLTSSLKRMAVLWDDLNPAAGNLSFRATSRTLTVAWQDVPESGNANSGNWAAVQLYDDGQFTFYYGGTTLEDGLVGISTGGLFPNNPPYFNSEDWSGANLSFGQRGFCWSHRFQQFLNSPYAGLSYDKFDAFTLGCPGPSRIHFVPYPGTPGYEFFTGTR